MVEMRVGIYEHAAKVADLPLRPSKIQQYAAANMKVLIIRFSSIGDIVLTSALLRCLKQQTEQLEVHYLTKAVFHDLVAHNPHVSKVHLLGNSMKSVINDLKTEEYDHVLDLHNNLRSKKVCRALGVPVSVVNKYNRRKWLMVNFPSSVSEAVPHIVDRYVASARELSIENDELGLELHIPADRHVDLETLPETHRPGFVAFAIGAAHMTKRLPLDLLIKLCGMISRPIVLIGGPSDAKNGQKISERIGARVHDLTGQLDILASASLIEKADALLCHDSGAMHIGCALKTPLVSIWGNTTPGIGFAPYRPDTPKAAFVSEVEDLNCRPCSKLGMNRCPKGHFKCMRNQPLQNIVSEMEHLIVEGH